MVSSDLGATFDPETRRRQDTFPRQNRKYNTITSSLQVSLHTLYLFKMFSQGKCYELTSL